MLVSSKLTRRRISSKHCWITLQLLVFYADALVIYSEYTLHTVFSSQLGSSCFTQVSFLRRYCPLWQSFQFVLTRIFVISTNPFSSVNRRFNLNRIYTYCLSSLPVCIYWRHTNGFALYLCQSQQPIIVAMQVKCTPGYLHVYTHSRTCTHTSRAIQDKRWFITKYEYKHSVSVVLKF